MNIFINGPQGEGKSQMAKLVAYLNGEYHVSTCSRCCTSDLLMKLQVSDLAQELFTVRPDTIVYDDVASKRELDTIMAAVGRYRGSANPRLMVIIVSQLNMGAQWT